MKKRITPIAMEIAMYCHEKMQGKNVSTKIKKWTPIVMEIATHCNERIQGGISVTKEWQFIYYAQYYAVCLIVR